MAVDAINSNTPAKNTNISNTYQNTSYFDYANMTASEIIDADSQGAKVPAKILNWAKGVYQNNPDSKETYNSKLGGGIDNIKDAANYVNTQDEDALEEICNQLNEMSAEYEKRDLNNISKMENSSAKSTNTQDNTTDKNVVEGNRVAFTESLEEMSKTIADYSNEAKESKKFGLKTALIAYVAMFTQKAHSIFSFGGFSNMGRSAEKALKQGGSTQKTAERAEAMASSKAQDNSAVIQATQSS